VNEWVAGHDSVAIIDEWVNRMVYINVGKRPPKDIWPVVTVSSVSTYELSSTLKDSGIQPWSVIIKDRDRILPVVKGYLKKE
jgi:hypothetical protein